jgi:thiol:disulfide interchange protein DsbC
MSINFKSALAVLAVAASITAHAGFEEDLIQRFPVAQGAKIEKAFPGFYSVVKGGEVVFVRDDLSILINGDVIDLKENKSIATQIREANKPKLDVAKLNTKDAIKFGSGKNKLYVFGDPDCPYCKQLENDLGRLQDTQVFVFPYPLTTIHPNARVIAESIWCSPNKQTAWKEYLIEGKKPKFATCDNPISRNLALGESHQIQGTPALIFEDGTIIPGAIPLQRIEVQISAAKGAKQ